MSKNPIPAFRSNKDLQRLPKCNFRLHFHQHGADSYRNCISKRYIIKQKLFYDLTNKEHRMKLVKCDLSHQIDPFACSLSKADGKIKAFKKFHVYLLSSKQNITYRKSMSTTTYFQLPKAYNATDLVG